MALVRWLLNVLITLTVGMTSGPLPGIAVAADAQELVVGIATWDYDTFDPHKSTYTEAHYVFMNMFDPLVWLGPDFKIQPGLATAWEPAEGGKTWTFHLRRDVRFHDGTPFNAEAVKFNFDRIADPKTQSKRAKDLLGPYQGTEIIDPYTVRVRFTAPHPGLPLNLTRHFTAMMSPTAV